MFINCIIIRVLDTHTQTVARNRKPMALRPPQRDDHFSVDAILLLLMADDATVTVTNLNHCTPYFECISQTKQMRVALFAFLSLHSNIMWIILHSNCTINTVQCNILPITNYTYLYGLLCIIIFYECSGYLTLYWLLVMHANAKACLYVNWLIEF